MKQSGAILIQTLIFVTVLALLSIAMVEITQAEIRTSRAHQQQYDSFAQADNAALEGERWVSSIGFKPIEKKHCATLPCIYSLVSQRNFHDLAAWKKLATNLGDAEQPRYFMVELLARYVDLKKKITTDYYQITAISWLQQDKTLRIIQRVVSKKFDKDGKAINRQVQRHGWRLVR